MMPIMNTAGPTRAKSGMSFGLNMNMAKMGRTPNRTGPSSKVTVAVRCERTASCSAGVSDGARPVAAVTAARMAWNHSATRALKVEGRPKKPFTGERNTRWVRPPSS